VAVLQSICPKTLFRVAGRGCAVGGRRLIGGFVLNEAQDRSFRRQRDAAIALLLMLLAFAVRIHNIGFNSLSEDESAKWLAIQEYRHGHFAGVNSEHPMLPKALAWASLSIGERWTRVASLHGWPAMNVEGWLRLPNVLFGAATAAILYLFCRQMMGAAGSFAAGFFWAVASLPVAINRLVKEETPVTFFTLLACYLYMRAKQASTETSTRRWHMLSGLTFGLAMASQYMLHLFGLNSLAWYVAGRRGLDHKRLGYFRLLVMVLLALLLANPLILSPTSCLAAIHWLKLGTIRHTGYDFAGTLYPNSPARVFSGVPWYFYFWLLLAKTPIPILVAIVVGSILLLRDRQTLASCFFCSLGLVQLLALSISGAKWIRYSLIIMPFLLMAGGYAVQQMWQYATERRVPRLAFAMAAVILFGWPLIELCAWTPYYPFYLNAIGGGTKNITRYFAPDEVAEFDTREVAGKICPIAPPGLRVATARPLSMGFYVKNCGRPDIQVLALYDSMYVPREGDVIVLEPSRRFMETQRFFDYLPASTSPNEEIRVGPVQASTIYLFQSSARYPIYASQKLTGAQSPRRTFVSNNIVR
jgi:Dolichyl-phosphate-mannose-protein mannosyltransferase